MSKSEVLHRQKGIGYLVLKSGTRKQVEWEIDQLSDGSLGNGCIRGDEEHLAAAAEDGCAKLGLASSMTAAIAVNRYEDGEALFTTLLISSAPAVFYAQTIAGSSTILDGSQFSTEFSGANGEQLRVIVPTIVMRDYQAVLQKVVPPSSSTSARTSYFQHIKTWSTATTTIHSFVCLIFNDDLPLALSPGGARELAAELIERAEYVETRSQTAQ
jgi:hypothetical protein